MTEEKLLRICIALIVATSPFFLWLVLRVANPQSQAELITQISRMRKLRWTSYIVGLAIWLFCFIDHPFRPYWNFGTGVIGASVGLEIPKAWLKNRLARYAKQANSPPHTIPHES